LIRIAVAAAAAAIALAGIAEASTPRPPEELVLRAYTIVGSPEGQAAADFRNAVLPLLRGDTSVRRAFLVWVTYGDDSNASVALLVEAPFNPALRAEIGRVFVAMFNADQSLDIIFVDADRAGGAEAQATPFYRRG